jgi:transposase-like protein
MTLLGYLYNEENGIWYKEPWKTKDGKFPLITKKRKYKNTKIPKEIKEKIIEYRNQNYSIGKISERLNVSETSVWKICQNILK